MRKLLVTLSLISLLLVSGMALAQQNSDTQALVEAARKARNTPHQPVKHVLTNDEVGSPFVPQPANVKGAGGEASPAGADAKPSDPAGKAVALKAEWKAKVDAQKKVIAELEAEGSKAEEQLRQRSSAAYADLGMRLNNEQKFVADDTKLRDDIAKRQEKLAAARAALDQMLEDARKAGVEGSLD